MLPRMRDMAIEDLVQRAIRHQRMGIHHLVDLVYNYLCGLKVQLACLYSRIFKRRKFRFRGNAYRYFYHEYNCTWTNERAVEVPIVWECVRRFDGKRILEVGNVLSHYFRISHDVVDKYEPGAGVINEDIVRYTSRDDYDLIVSISTIEHIGWDEPEKKDVGKILRVIENMQRLCSPGGTILVTWPVGYNTALDRMYDSGRLQFSEQYFMKKKTEGNLWVETVWGDIREIKYGSPFRGANGLIIGILRLTDEVMLDVKSAEVS